MAAKAVASGRAGEGQVGARGFGQKQPDSIKLTAPHPELCLLSCKDEDKRGLCLCPGFSSEGKTVLQPIIHMEAAVPGPRLLPAVASFSWLEPSALLSRI